MWKMNPEDEMLQCYDGNGVPTEGRLHADRDPEAPRWWVGITRIIIVDSAGRWLCSRRGAGVDINPGKWQTHVGGYVALGETHIQCAERELFKETGWRVPRESFLLVRKDRIPSRMLFAETYVVKFTGDDSVFRFDRREIAETKWMTPEEYWDDKMDNSNDWVNGANEQLLWQVEDLLKKV